MELNEPDRLLIDQLRKNDILENVQSHQINGDGRHIVLMCSDGHQIEQVITHRNYIKTETECCCHSHMLNGGALLLSPRFAPRTRLPVREVLLSQIRKSFALKGANTVALYVHAPCGAAQLRKLSFSDVLDRLFEAKTTVKQRFSKRRKLQVVCFVQIDFGGGKKRSYYVSRKKWETWKADHSAKPAQ